MRNAWIAGSAIAAAVTVAVVVAARPARRKPVITSLDDRYRLAVDDTRHWLQTWGELRAARTDKLQHVERLLLDEALHGAEDAAAEAIRRRDRCATRFLSNGFERLELCIATESETQEAIEIIERYLDTLWVDSKITSRAQDRLAQARPRSRHGVVEEASRIALLAPSYAAGAGKDLDAQRLRLQAERTLLRESPFADIDLFNDGL